jgi:membrane-bound metal-dependent hydrolase YbcI (DUF457 family)
VDPLSHSIVGHTLAAAFAPGPSARPDQRLCLTAALGALAPDLDAVLMPFGWDIYLRAHAAGTHSIAGSIPVACLVALVARRLFHAPRPDGLLLLTGWMGALSHLALDVLSGARIELGWPIVPGRVSLPLVAMAEPWLLAILAGGALTAAAAKHRPRRAAAACLAAAIVFLGAKGAMLGWTLRGLSSADRGPVLARLVDARWASLTEWNVYERRPDSLSHWVARGSRTPTHVLSWPLEPDTPLVERSRSLDTVRNFLDVHELGFAGEIPDGGEGSRVLWSDIRFCWSPGAADAGAEPDPVLTMATQKGLARIACGLWFGGAFDRNGRVLTQLVKVGAWWQTRAPAPSP